MGGLSYVSEGRLGANEFSEQATSGYRMCLLAYTSYLRHTIPGLYACQAGQPNTNALLIGGGILMVLRRSN